MIGEKVKIFFSYVFFALFLTLFSPEISSASEKDTPLPESQLAGIWEASKICMGRTFIYPEKNSVLDITCEGHPTVIIGTYRLFFKFDGEKLHRVSRFDDGIKFIGNFKGNGYKPSDYEGSWISESMPYSYKNNILTIDGLKYSLNRHYDGTVTIISAEGKPVAEIFRSDVFKMGYAKLPVWKRFKTSTEGSVARREEASRSKSSGIRLSPDSPWSDSDWQ